MTKAGGEAPECFGAVEMKVAKQNPAAGLELPLDYAPQLTDGIRQ